MFLFSKLMPREGKFFDLFDLHAEQMLLCAKELQLLMEDLEKGDPEKVELRTRNIKGFESAADRLTHQTMHLLHRTFITPLDREDIHQLINKMDDVLDLIEDASQCISLYDIKKVPAEGRKLAEICVTCVENLKGAIGMLSDLKHADAILRHCLEIDRLESEADHVMRDVIVKLFRDEPDTRELIKMKAVVELLETVTDRCEDVANIVEGIVIEYS
jgi:predicted phosphate transport protein (TIGR00153 family)